MRQFIIIGKQCAAISVAAQVFGGKKGSSTNISNGSGLYGFPIGENIVGSDGLGIIFNNGKPLNPGKFHDGSHVCTLSE